MIFFSRITAHFVVVWSVFGLFLYAPFGVVGTPGGGFDGIAIGGGVCSGSVVCTVARGDCDWQKAGIAIRIESPRKSIRKKGGGGEMWWKRMNVRCLAIV